MTWLFSTEYNIIYWIIGGWFIFSVYYIRKLAKDPDSVNPYIYDSIPTVFTTLGVFGTFIGIYYGLRQFDVDDINGSIPSLLEGLKTAFLTSIVGISFSLIIGKIAQYVLHSVENTTLQTNEIDALNKIVNILSETKNEINKMYKSLAGDNTDSVAMQLVKINNKFTEMQTMQTEKLNNIVSALGGDDETSLLSQIQKMRYEQNEFNATTQKSMKQNRDYIAEKFEEFIVLLARSNTEELVNTMEKATEQLKTLTEIQNTQTEKLDDIYFALDGDDETGLLFEIQNMRREQNGLIQENTEQIVAWISETNKEINAVQNSMEQNRDYIAKKFEEFIVLLAKSNTEELVNAMKAATAQFNEQMKELIDKLIKENFEELNNSVLRMNSWQQENKEMIGALTREFREVSQNFTVSAQSIREITQNTEKLTNDNSILKRLIEELQKVMIDDKKFSEITGKLSDTADKTQEITENLQKWIKDEKYFSDSVKTLLDKLENVEKIKDINEVFWQNLKKQLEDGVGMIGKANERLANDIEELDKSFESRLATVFANLDNLIAQALQYRYDAQAKQ
ncbi:MAG: MotA/TolQ/ExbB proton channel family protein [Campylobacteraceae bacterium]|jgi:phosphohistidine swiveling domain-containing protein|nr:MotA/TolQ/ExbB proton channel family protein [Campylobacteraceae bacterium]